MLDFSSVGRTGSRIVPSHSVVHRDYPSRGRNGYTSPTLSVGVPRYVAWLIVDYFASRSLVVDYFAYTADPVALARRAACRMAHRRLFRLRRASGCLGTSRGSSSTTSPTPYVRVPRYVARLIVWLVVDYFTSCRRVGHVSGCLSTSRGLLSTTSHMPRIWVPRHLARLIALFVVPLVIKYFAYAAHPGASTRRVAHRAAYRRLLHLRHASGCLGTSRGSSRGSSSTTLTTPRMRVPQHIARLATRLVATLVVDYFTYATRPGAMARHAARLVDHHRLLRLHHAFGCLGTSRGLLRGSSGR
jgi:hypothetical protein